MPSDVRHEARAAGARWGWLSRQAGGPDRRPGRSVLAAASFTAAPIAPGLGLGAADAEPQRNPPTLAFSDYNPLFQVCLQPHAHGAGDADADDVVLLWRIED